MRYLIFSDVHANLFGLQYILRQALRIKPDKIICLGDIIGYNSFPKECIQEMVNNKIPSVKGNHEAMVAEELSLSTCNRERGQHVARKTRQLLDAQDMKYIRSLKFSQTINDRAIIFHATPESLTETLNTKEKAFKAFLFLNKNNHSIAFFGHTHRAMAFIADKELHDIEQLNTVQKIKLQEDNLYLINPGTAGEARHGSKYSFITYDDSKNIIEYHYFRLPEKEQKELAKRNRKLFGVTSFERFPKQVKEQLRNIYYKMDKTKTQVFRNSN